MEKQLQNEVFQAEMERKLAQLLSEVPTRRRMWRRATVAAGNSVVQVMAEGGSGSWRARRKPAVPHANGKCQEKILIATDCAFGQPLNAAALGANLRPGRVD